MIRVIGAVIGFAVLVSVLTGGNTIAIWAAIVLGSVGIGLPLLMGQTKLRCPYCRKRVKLGATACHHCGRTISTQG